eukprot:TRINITY_DN53590_c0_g1_i1.p2 TRINITY_DN53590_c0_g1~~TRINITY_DN53590_c0_g1_i1.p2  ORF type:complete len:116 (-),score=20.81 TRINITY_DN53590_c0_g1_i1:14-361(-)
MMTIMIMFFIASVSATEFCGDTKIIKEYIPKRELCPGSRSVSAILKDLACVEGSIKELTTALVTAHATGVDVPVQDVVTDKAAPPQGDTKKDEPSLWSKITAFFSGKKTPVGRER